MLSCINTDGYIVTFNDGQIVTTNRRAKYISTKLVYIDDDNNIVIMDITDEKQDIKHVKLEAESVVKFIELFNGYLVFYVSGRCDLIILPSTIKTLANDIIDVTNIGNGYYGHLTVLMLHRDGRSTHITIKCSETPFQMKCANHDNPYNLMVKNIVDNGRSAERLVVYNSKCLIIDNYGELWQLMRHMSFVVENKSNGKVQYNLGSPIVDIIPGAMNTLALVVLSDGTVKLLLLSDITASHKNIITIKIPNGDNIIQCARSNDNDHQVYLLTDTGQVLMCSSGTQDVTDTGLRNIIQLHEHQAISRRMKSTKVAIHAN